MQSGRNLVVPIAVTAQLRRLHPLVAELRAAAKHAQEDKGVLALNYSKVLRVRTSPRCLARALIWINTLIKEFESRGYKVRIGQRAETELILEEGAISFRLDERTKQTAPPPLSPRPKGGRTPFNEPWRPAFVLVATGEFTLAFERYRLHGCRHSWRDRPGATLESQLHEVMEAIPSWEAALKTRRVEKERLELSAREAEMRRVAGAREQEILSRQRARFVSDLSAWERAERLRRFIVAVQEIGSPDDETRAWLDWASGQVRALDPLCSRLSDVTNLDAKLEDSFTGYSAWECPEAVSDWQASKNEPDQEIAERNEEIAQLRNQLFKAAQERQQREAQEAKDKDGRKAYVRRMKRAEHADDLAQLLDLTSPARIERIQREYQLSSEARVGELLDRVPPAVRSACLRAHEDAWIFGLELCRRLLGSAKSSRRLPPGGIPWPSWTPKGFPMAGTPRFSPFETPAPRIDS